MEEEKKAAHKAKPYDRKQGKKISWDDPPASTSTDARNDEGANAGMGSVDGTTQRAVIIRNPYNNDRTMTIKGFKNVHHLVIQTFKTRGSCHTQNLNDARRQLYTVAPSWYFDTGELGMYMTDKLIEELKRHTNPTSPISPNMVKIKRVAGKISQFGIGAPFVAGAADQAATNSMVAQSVMVSANLHEKMLVKKGRIVLNSSTAGIPTVTSFEAAQVQLNSAGNVTGHANINDWELIGKCRNATTIPTQTAAGTIYFELLDEASDEAFQFYEQVSVTPVPVPTTIAIQANVPITLPKKAPHSVLVDMTESQGVICEWNEDCDWLISKPNAIMESVGFGSASISLNVDHAQTVTLIAGQKEHVPADNKVVETVDSSFNYYLSHVGKNGNYVDTAPGKDTINQAQTLPTFNIHMVTPPTKANANGQHVLMPIVLETEIDFEISFDSTYCLPLTESTNSFSLVTGNPKFVNFFKREQGTFKIHSSQLHAQKWGTNPMYFN